MARKPRKSRAERFAPLEDESIRKQIPKKILPLIEQLVTEQCVPLTAALTLRMKLLEIQVRELQERLNRLDPHPHRPMAARAPEIAPRMPTIPKKPPTTPRTIISALGMTTKRTMRSRFDQGIG